jgi:hypothetical protein
MTERDTEPPFPKHRTYYVILKYAVLVAAVLLALATYVRYA